MINTPNRRIAGVVRAWTLWLALAGIAVIPSAVSAADPKTVAVLSVRLINDNADLVPTTKEETARLQVLEDTLKTKLEATGKYKFIEVPSDMKARIAKAQNIGECGGCDIDFGKELKVDEIAWINVQKISTLILNLNVYMADVTANKMSFVHSVDMRGDTDESWARSMNIIIKNYLLPEKGL